MKKSIFKTRLVCTLAISWLFISCNHEEQEPTLTKNNDVEKLTINKPSQVVLLAQNGHIMLPTYNNCMDFYADLFMASGNSVDIPCVSNSNESIAISTPWTSESSIVEEEGKVFFILKILNENDSFYQVETLKAMRGGQPFAHLKFDRKEASVLTYKGELIPSIIDRDKLSANITIYDGFLPVAQVDWVFEDDLIMKWVLEDNLILQYYVFEDHVIMRTNLIDGEEVEEWTIGSHINIQKFPTKGYTKIHRRFNDFALVDWVYEDNIIFKASESVSPLTISFTIKDDLIMGLIIGDGILQPTSHVYEDNVMFRTNGSNKRSGTSALTAEENSLFSIAEVANNVFEDHIFLKTGISGNDITLEHIIEEHVMIMHFVTEDHVILGVSLTNDDDVTYSIYQAPTENYTSSISIVPNGEFLDITAELICQEGQEVSFPTSLILKGSSSGTLPELSLAQKLFGSATYKGAIGKAVLKENNIISVLPYEQTTITQHTIKDDIL